MDEGGGGTRMERREVAACVMGWGRGGVKVRSVMLGVGQMKVGER